MYSTISLNTTFTLINVSRHLWKRGRMIKRYWFRKFSAESINVKPKGRRYLNQPPLNESLPGLPNVTYIAPKPSEYFTSLTKLCNGTRIASENRFGQFCTVGVAFNSGSRYEYAYPSGVSTFVEKLAFQSTRKFANKAAIMKELEDCGGIFDCQSTRDVTIYAVSAVRTELNRIMNVLADVVYQPNITNEELRDTQLAVKYELENLKRKPDQDLVLKDMIHAAAFKNNTIGLPKICPENNISRIDRSVLFTFLKNYHPLHRMVVAGIGVNHDMLLDTVKKYFVDGEPCWNKLADLIKTGTHFNPDNSIARYTGGIVQECCEIPQFHGPAPLPEVAHLVIGFEGVAYGDKDFIPLSVLHMMMGGGRSFCSGGPGRGMFTRLYLNILNEHSWIYNATTYNYSYVDSGLFYIHASTTPENLSNLAEVIIKELIAMTGKIYVEELARAKKQLQSMLLMNLEAKPVIFEDLARQVLVNGFRKQPIVFLRQIENVTYEDITQVASRILSSPVSVAARGNLTKLPKYTDIQSALSSYDIKYQTKTHNRL